MKGALADAGRALEAGPDFGPALMTRGTLFLELGRLEDSLSDFDRLIEIQPRNARAFGYRARLHSDAGRLEEAMKDFDRALVLEKGSKMMWFTGRSDTLGKLGRFDEAVEDATKALKENPDFVFALVKRGVAYLGGGKAAKALEDFERALALEPRARGFLDPHIARAKKALEEN